MHKLISILNSINPLTYPILDAVLCVVGFSRSRRHSG